MNPAFDFDTEEDKTTRYFSAIYCTFFYKVDESCKDLKCSSYVKKTHSKLEEEAISYY